MRKALLVSLSLAMILSFTACGTSNKNNNTNNSTTQTSTANNNITGGTKSETTTENTSNMTNGATAETTTENTATTNADQDDETTLTGEAQGYGGTVTVTVTKKDDKITDVKVEGPDETTGVGSKAIEQLPDLIVAANGTTGVDAVSGATVTSTAIFTAFDKAVSSDK